MEKTETTERRFRYTAPPARLFEGNRRKFAGQMLPGTCAAFWSNDLLASNADAHYNFQQDSNMYYLSGIDQEDCVLLIFPDAPKEEMREILFVKQTSEKIQIWEGWKYSREEATAASGIQTVKYLNEFEQVLRTCVSYSSGLYLDYNENDKQSHISVSASLRYAEKIRKEFPSQNLLRAAPVLTHLRMLKSQEEVAQIQKACEITGNAFRRVLRTIRPDVMEIEVEAEIAHEFIRSGASGPAYSSIIASGKNACVLHYTGNSEVCKEGDILLMDFGAEYGNYSADLSRSVPVNGRFSKRQRDVYDAVLRVMKQAKSALVPGSKLDDYQEQVGEWMTAELLGLGLMTKTDIQLQDPAWPAYKKYFMHGTSHHIGLDTHDLSDRYKPFAAGMVLTVEPGIYIPEENMGIRIENDILITESGNTDLMAGIPIEAQEIEQIMNERN